ncbi:MAG: ParA family protein [Sulfolobaceae archaeon]|nr:ParA family protein [Sulfolobaceae archaeon]
MKLRLKVIGVKGGVGKTTIALASAFYLSRRYRVLYIDKDLLSFASNVLGFSGRGFHAAVIENLEREEYEYKVNENLILFKMFSDPLKEMELHRLAYSNKRKCVEAYLDVVSKNYDVIIVDYGLVFDTNNPLAYDEFNLFVQHFPEYTIGGVGVTDALKEDIINNVEYYKRTIRAINARPIAFVVNMVFPEVREEVQSLVNKIKGDLPGGDVILIPYKEEFRDFSKVKEENELSEVGKLIEKYLSLL